MTFSIVGYEGKVSFTPVIESTDALLICSAYLRLANIGSQAKVKAQFESHFTLDQITKFKADLKRLRNMESQEVKFKSILNEFDCAGHIDSLGKIIWNININLGTQNLTLELTADQSFIPDMLTGLDLLIKK